MSPGTEWAPGPSGLGGTKDKIRFLEPWLPICPPMPSWLPLPRLHRLSHGLDATAWASVDVALGNVPSLRILGNIPADALRLAVHAARVAVPERGTPGEPDHVPAAQRGLTVVESTQVGLLWRVARRKAEKADAELFLTTPTPGRRPRPRPRRARGTTLPKGRSR